MVAVMAETAITVAVGSGLNDPNGTFAPKTGRAGIFLEIRADP
jgi:hypothetical protein